MLWRPWTQAKIYPFLTKDVSNVETIQKLLGISMSLCQWCWLRATTIRKVEAEGWQTARKFGESAQRSGASSRRSLSFLAVSKVTELSLSWMGVVSFSLLTSSHRVKLAGTALRVYYQILSSNMSLLCVVPMGINFGSTCFYIKVASWTLRVARDSD